MSQQRSKFAGLTLVELLVVVVILVILVAVVLPLAQPTPQSRLVREAARQVNTFISSARSRAMTTGQPQGVMLVSSDNRCWQLAATKLSLPFSGDPKDLRIQISNVIPAPVDEHNDPYSDQDDFRGAIQFFNPPNSTDAPGTDGVIPAPPTLWNTTSSGDEFRIKIHHRGKYLTGRRGDRDTTDGPPEDVFYVELPSADIPVGAEAAGNGLVFQFERPPRKTLSAPMELPTGAYIDLLASGGGDDTLPSGTHSFMFDSLGRLTNGENVYLLIGAQTKSKYGATFDYLRNLDRDVPASWVVVTKQRVATSENTGANVDPSSLQLNGTQFSDEDLFKNAVIAHYRKNALSGPVAGGR